MYLCSIHLSLSTCTLDMFDQMWIKHWPCVLAQLAWVQDPGNSIPLKPKPTFRLFTKSHANCMHQDKSYQSPEKYSKILFTLPRSEETPLCGPLLCKASFPLPSCPQQCSPRLQARNKYKITKSLSTSRPPSCQHGGGRQGQLWPVPPNPKWSKRRGTGQLILPRREGKSIEETTFPLPHTSPHYPTHKSPNLGRSQPAGVREGYPQCTQMHFDRKAAGWGWVFCIE